MSPERYARIKDLFTQAAELAESQREQFLSRECGSDVELKQEVQQLLKHDYSQTIIAAGDTTVADLSSSIGDSPPRTFVRQLQGWSSLTKHLGPRGHLAIGGLLSCIVLALLGYFGSQSVRQFQRELRREALDEIVDGKVMALEMWLEHEQAKVASWGRSNNLRRLVGQLVGNANESLEFQDRVKASLLQEQIREEIYSFAGHDAKYSIWDRRHLLIADAGSGVDHIEKSATPWAAGILAFAFEGHTRIIALDKQRSITHFDAALLIEPHLGTVTPIRDDDGRVLAALLVHDFASRKNASRILRMIRLGQSGETYVFNREGLMLSESRFDPQLRELGLITDDPAALSARGITLRDPGGDLTAGFVPREPLATQPLTKMARSCIAGNDGADLDGYRDYRGVNVVGAWRWLEHLEVGVATELDVDEAEPGLSVLVWEIWIVLGLFATCLGIAQLFSFYSVHRIRQQVGANHKLGRYELERQIGEGGMGKVFKARHDLLKRPTAVKLLKPEFRDQASIARFAREAQLASQLEHPNTVRIYDYGVTPEGLFYYVMEFINGLSLTELLKLESRIPPARTVFLLRQICNSLSEAHGAGLVHRDLKPSNIMLCRRGGNSDVVKVLDFGLVKHIDTSKSLQITSTHLVAGTPQYIAPERLGAPQTSHPRSDIYSLGAVVFFLLTGRDFVDGGSLAEVLMQVVSAPPVRPSDCIDAEIPPELDELVYNCLAKDPNKRPASVEEIIAILDDIDLASQWTQLDADSWWGRQPTRKLDS